jgi:hypothetical protein
MQDGRDILQYGPWSSTCGHEERCRQLRCMAAIAYMLLGPAHPLWRACRAGEADAMAFLEAQDLVEALPSLHRRRLLATHMAITWPRPGRAP